MKIKEQVIELRKQGKTIPEICEILDISKGTVGYHLKNSSLVWNKKHSKEIREKMSKGQKERFKNKSSKSKYQKYTLIPKEKHKRNQKGYINPKALDCWPILKGEKEIKGKYHSSIRGQIKKFIIKKDILPYMCDFCKRDNNWMGSKMPLILDHKNGINYDHRLENLRFLCSNCDSIQPTYKGKNKKK